MRNRIFISHVVPKNTVEKLSVSAAANYFSYNLIDNQCFDEVYSLIPTNIEDKIKSDKDKVKFIQTRFICNKGLFKVFNIILDNLKLYFRVRKKSDVWFYNLTHQTILVYLLLRSFKADARVYVILLDFTPSVSMFSLQNFILNNINKANGIISLTKNNKLSNNNSVILPGVVPEGNSIKRQQSINNIFLLAGILSENRCPELVLSAFSKTPELTLVITGRIDDKSLIERYVETNDNIIYHGFLDYKEYLKVLENATYSINSRDPDFEENHYNFPSKTVEHLKHNKIIISTMKYEELDGINYFYITPNVSDFVSFLKELKFKDNDFLLANYANQSTKIFDKFGVPQWKKALSLLEIVQ